MSSRPCANCKTSQRRLLFSTNSHSTTTPPLISDKGDKKIKESKNHKNHNKIVCELIGLNWIIIGLSSSLEMRSHANKSYNCFPWVLLCVAACSFVIPWCQSRGIIQRKEINKVLILTLNFFLFLSWSDVDIEGVGCASFGEFELLLWKFSLPWLIEINKFYTIFNRTRVLWRTWKALGLDCLTATRTRRTFSGRTAATNNPQDSAAAKVPASDGCSCGRVSNHDG